MSCVISYQLYLGLPCDLLVRGFQLNIFLTVLVSSILCMWPTQLSLWALMWLIIFLCFSAYLILHWVWLSTFGFLLGAQINTHLSEAKVTIGLITVLPSQTIKVISFRRRLWTRFKRSVVQRLSVPPLRMSAFTPFRWIITAFSKDEQIGSTKTQHNVGSVKKCDRNAVRVFVYPQQAQLTVESLHFHTHSLVQSTLAIHRFALRLFAIATREILMPKIRYPPQIPVITTRYPTKFHV
jgi:hypothetical protein